MLPPVAIMFMLLVMAFSAGILLPILFDEWKRKKRLKQYYKDNCR